MIGTVIILYKLTYTPSLVSPFTALFSIRTVFIVNGMIVTIALLLLVCSGGSALSPQEDCGNDNVQTAWLFNNTPLACVRAFNEIYPDDFLTQDNVEHVKW